MSEQCDFLILVRSTMASKRRQSTDEEMRQLHLCGWSLQSVPGLDESTQMMIEASDHWLLGLTCEVIWGRKRKN